MDCQWFNANLEAYFCETLGNEELLLVSEHLTTCLSCRNEVQSLRDVDPMVRQVLDYRMTKARLAASAPRRSIGFQLGLAGAGVALAAAIVFGVFLHQANEPGGSASIVPPTLQSSDSPDTKAGKGSDSTPTVRAKPVAPDQPAAVKSIAPEPIIPAGAPEFAVIDPSGYSKSLSDYRGRVLLIGIWSADRKETAQNLQRVYQALGTRRNLSVLGVSRRKQDPLPGMTFPVVFNDGSRLLEARDFEYVVVDKEGHEQLRGSLAGDSNALISKIRTKLEQLGVR